MPLGQCGHLATSALVVVHFPIPGKRTEIESTVLLSLLHLNNPIKIKGDLNAGVCALLSQGLDSSSLIFLHFLNDILTSKK